MKQMGEDEARRGADEKQRRDDAADDQTPPVFVTETHQVSERVGDGRSDLHAWPPLAWMA